MAAPTASEPYLINVRREWRERWTCLFITINKKPRANNCKRHFFALREVLSAGNTLPMKLIPFVLLCAAASPALAQNSDLAPLPLRLPPPALKGTPADLPTNTTAEPLNDKPRPVFYAAKGVVNVALHKPVTASTTALITGDLSLLTDGKKEAYEENVLTLRRGPQWVQVDLQGEYKIYAVALWHDFSAPNVVRGVVVQLSDDPEFKTGVTTIFNDDHMNKDNLGVGTDREYFENSLTGAGKLIDAKGAKARYLRCYSDGSTANALNTYIEVEAFGLPAS